MVQFIHSFKLTKKMWIDRMVSLPEDGMGFQLVDVTLTDHTVVKRVLVFGCEDVQFQVGQKIFTENEIASIKSSHN